MALSEESESEFEYASEQESDSESDAIIGDDHDDFDLYNDADAELLIAQDEQLLGAFDTEANASLPSLSPPQLAGETIQDPPSLRSSLWDSLIRVGVQPRRTQITTRTAPLQFVKQALSHRFKMCLTMDQLRRGFPTMTKFREVLTSILTTTISSFTEIEHNFVTRLCDYTSLPLQFSPGPQSFSIEAVYPFCKAGGLLSYHSNPNVHVIGTAINLYAKSLPPVLLGIIGVALNICSLGSFDDQEQLCHWIYNAACNVTSMTVAFKLHVNIIKQRLDLWSTWTDEQLRDVLETIRTGRIFGTASGILSRYKGKHFRFTVRKKVNSTTRLKLVYKGRKLYEVLIAIAAKYGLTRTEFEFYLTIRTIGGGRVFYPFHPISRLHAIEEGWNWCTLLLVCAEVLLRMQTACNRFAQRAGLGEAVDAEFLVYWIAHYYCNKIQQLKLQHPNAKPEKIRYYAFLDRWSLPIVPWICHPFSASFCKGPDHGIAMLFGLLKLYTCPDFDPVEDIDISRSTIAIDTKTTNLAMLNYSVNDWENIRSTFAHLPLHHVFWKVDPSLGMSIWFGSEKQTAPTIAPQPACSIEMLPIDHWLDGKCNPVTFRCHLCPAHYLTAGGLLQHCHGRHPLSQALSIQRVADPDTREIITSAEWDNWKAIKSRLAQTHFTCMVCRERFASIQELGEHRQSAHSIFSNLHFPCPDCGRSFATEFELHRHCLLDHTGIDNNKLFHCSYCEEVFQLQYQCQEHEGSAHDIHHFRCSIEDCAQHFPSRYELAIHIARHHLKMKRFKCRDCGKKFSDLEAVQQHRRSVHPETIWLCDKEDCEIEFRGPAQLVRHQAQYHDMEKKYYCFTCRDFFKTLEEIRTHQETQHPDHTFICHYAECSYACNRKSALHKHINNKHLKLSTFACQDCTETFTTKAKLLEHVRSAHEGVKFECPVAGCDSEFTMERSLEHHLRTAHSM